MWSPRRGAGRRPVIQPCAACWIGSNACSETCFTIPKARYRRPTKTRCVRSRCTAQRAWSHRWCCSADWALACVRRTRPGGIGLPGRGLAVHCGRFETPDWDAVRERAAATAEALRLWYVAATRAREHLVISLFRSPNSACPAARIVELLEPPESGGYQWLDLPADFEQGNFATATNGTVGMSVTEYVEAEGRWSAERSERLRRLGAQLVATPSGMHDTQPSPETSSSRPRSGRNYGSALGLAVHAVLQRADLASLSNLDDLARTAAREYAVDVDVVASCARRAALSAPVREAVTRGRSGARYQLVFASTRRSLRAPSTCSGNTPTERWAWWTTRPTTSRPRH